MRVVVGGFSSACFLLLLLPLVAAVLAQSPSVTGYDMNVRSTTLLVFIDGSVEVNQTATPSQNMTSVKLPLLSTQVGDVLAIDQSKSLLPYELSGQNITVYTLGATRLSLSYDTPALTTKQGTLWTLSFNSLYNVTLILPAQSTALYLSGAPVSASTKNNRPTFVLTPGSWEISYGLAIGASQTTSSATGTATASGQGGSNSLGQGAAAGALLSTWGIVVAGALIAIGAALVFIARSRRKGISGVGGLRLGDAEMLRFIDEKGGKVVEAEIREHLSLPRTSVWRQAKRLEKLGFVRISKIGMQNQIELIRRDFESGESQPL